MPLRYPKSCSLSLLDAAYVGLGNLSTVIATAMSVRHI